jgi:hypothetical protein
MPDIFPDCLWSITDPDNGTIGFNTARYSAEIHHLLDQFDTDYGTNPFRVDTGEFLVWLGY